MIFREKKMLHSKQLKTDLIIQKINILPNSRFCRPFEWTISRSRSNFNNRSTNHLFTTPFQVPYWEFTVLFLFPYATLGCFLTQTLSLTTVMWLQPRVSPDEITDKKYGGQRSQQLIRNSKSEQIKVDSKIENLLCSKISCETIKCFVQKHKLLLGLSYGRIGLMEFQLPRFQFLQQNVIEMYHK